MARLCSDIAVPALAFVTGCLRAPHSRSDCMLASEFQVRLVPGSNPEAPPLSDPIWPMDFG